MAWVLDRVEGWEHGRASTTGGGLVNVLTNAIALARTTMGSDFCAECSPGAAAAGIWHANTLVANPPNVAVKFDFEVPTLPASDLEIFSFYSGSGQYERIYLQSDGKFRMQNHAGTSSFLSTNAYIAGDIVHFEVRALIASTGNRTVRWKIDGGDANTYTDANVSTTKWSAFRFGSASTAGPAATLYYDNAVMWTSTSATEEAAYPTTSDPSLVVIGHAPNADAGHTTGGANFRTQAGTAIVDGTTTVWTLIDDIGATADAADYVEKFAGTGAIATQHVKIAFEDASAHGMGTATPKEVSAYFGLQEGASQAEVAIVDLTVNAVTATLFSGDIGQTALGHFHGRTVTATITATHVDAMTLRFGGTDASPVIRLHYALVQVAWLPSAGGTVTYAATPAGQAAVVAALVRTLTLAATPAAVAVAAVALARTVTFGASVSGQGTVAAALTVTAGGALVTFDAAVAGQAAVAAASAPTRSLAAPVAGLAAVSAADVVQRSLAAVVAGQAAVVAPVAVQRSLAAPVVGQGAIVVNLFAPVGLAATVSGQAALAAALTATRAVAATVAGQGAIVAAIGGVVPLAAVVRPGDEVMVGEVKVGTVKVGEVIHDAEIVVTSLNLAQLMSATVAGQASLSAAETRTIGLAAAAAGQAAITAAESPIRALAATVAALAQVAVAEAPIRSLSSAPVAGQASLTVDVTTSKNLAAVVAGQAAVTAAITVTVAGNFVQFDVTVAGQGAIAVPLAVTHVFSAPVAGLATVTAVEGTIKQLAAVVAGSGSVSSALARTRALAAVLSLVGGQVTAGASRVKGLDATVSGQAAINVVTSRSVLLAALVQAVGRVEAAYYFKRLLTAAVACDVVDLVTTACDVVDLLTGAGVINVGEITVGVAKVGAIGSDAATLDLDAAVCDDDVWTAASSDTLQLVGAPEYLG